MTSLLQPIVGNRQSELSYALADELRLPDVKLYPFTRLMDDLFLDRVDIDLLIAGLEQKLNYFLTEEEASQIETIGDLHTFFLR